MIARARYFFQQRAEENDQVIIPAQSLAEFLVGYTEEQCQQSLAALSKGFIIAPFDAKAAAIAASLQRDWNQLRKIAIKFGGLTKQQIKSDINVLASAIAAGASHLYSDPQMPSFAQGKIIVERLPELPPA